MFLGSHTLKVLTHQAPSDAKMQIFHWQMFSVHTKRDVNMRINHQRNVAVAEDIKRFWQEEAKQDKLLCFMKLDTLSISNTQTHVSQDTRLD